MALAAEQQPTATPEALADVEVRAARAPADRGAFVRFPYALYRNDPHWVPPLEMAVRDFLDPQKNPWFEFGEADLFVARRGGEVVGRIAAVQDPRYNAFHGTHHGFFGFFECVDDVEVARALFDAAGAWLKARGYADMLGPFNFSTNYECAVLVEGFEQDPAIMMTYNPPYYARLYEACGFAKAKDLYAWELSSAALPPEKVVRIADKVKQREGITVRTLRLHEFQQEVARLKKVYNGAWEKNWGFVPVTDREFDHIARDLKQVVVPELVLVAEVGGEPVAFSMTVPDANQALKAAGGRLTRFGLPVGLVKLLLASRSIKRLRLITLGIVEGYRRRGIDAVLYLETLRTARAKGYSGGEISWTLEDNHLVNRAIESMGGTRSKTYRIYQRSL